MELKAFIDALSEDERSAFASRCGTTWGHLRNVMYGTRVCSTELAAAIDRESFGAVTCEEMRHDITWHRVPDAAWPWHPEGKPLVDVLPSEIVR